MYKLKLSIYIPAFFLLLLVGCAQSSETDIPIISADTRYNAKLSNLFNSITIVPLETRLGGLIGTDVIRIEVIEDKVFMLNETPAGANILCFHSSGRFLFYIDKFGPGPQEYTILSDFFIDRTRENLVLSTARGRFFQIDLTGQFLEIIQADDIYRERRMVYLNDSTILSFNDPRSVLPGIDLIALDPETFNIREKSNIRGSLTGLLHPLLPISIHSDRVLYCALDTIFDVTDISNRKAMYVVDFGRAHRASMNTLVRHAETMSFNRLFDRARNMFIHRQLFGVRALFENSRFLAISCLQNTTSAEFELEPFFLLHDKESGRTYNSRNIAFDALNLPDMGQFSILGRYGETFYAIFTPDWSQRDRMLRSEYISDTLRQHILEADEEDNPWLVIFR